MNTALIFPPLFYSHTGITLNRSDSVKTFLWVQSRLVKLLTSAKSLMVCVKDQRTVMWTCRLTHGHQKHTPYPVMCVAVISVHSVFHVVQPHSCLFRCMKLVNGLIMNLTWVASLVHTSSDLWRTPGDRPKLWGPQRCNVLLLMIFVSNFGFCVCCRGFLHL